MSRKIDALVAEHVMGMNGVRFDDEWQRYVYDRRCIDRSRRRAGSASIWTVTKSSISKYSSTIAAAWKVVEKLGGADKGTGACVSLEFDGWWTVKIGTVWSSGDHVPLAICLAALKAKGVKHG